MSIGHLVPEQSPYSALIRVKELEDFEDKLANMIENLKERTHHNSFQTQLKKDAMVGHWSGEKI